LNEISSENSEKRDHQSLKINMSKYLLANRF